MNTPNINDVKAMSSEERKTLNSQISRKLATHVVGMIFLKLSIAGVTRVLAKKALIAAAKHV